MNIPASTPKAIPILAKIISDAKFPAPCLIKGSAESLAEQILIELARRGINAADAIASIPMETNDIRDL